MSDEKPKAYIKEYRKSNLPSSYIEYKPYVPSKRTDKIKTYGNVIERILN